MHGHIYSLPACARDASSRWSPGYILTKIASWRIRPLTNKWVYLPKYLYFNLYLYKVWIMCKYMLSVNQNEFNSKPKMYRTLQLILLFEWCVGVHRRIVPHLIFSGSAPLTLDYYPEAWARVAWCMVASLNVWRRPVNRSIILYS